MSVEEAERVLTESVGDVISVNCHLLSRMSGYQDMMYAGQINSGSHYFVLSLEEFVDGVDRFKGMSVRDNVGESVDLNDDGSFSLYGCHRNWPGRFLNFGINDTQRVRELWNARLSGDGDVDGGSE